MCLNHKPRLQDKFIMSEPVRYDFFKAMCDKLNGTLPTPADYVNMLFYHERVRQAYMDLKPIPKQCMLDKQMTKVTFWSGQQYDSELKLWENPYNNRVN